MRKRKRNVSHADRGTFYEYSPADLETARMFFRDFRVTETPETCDMTTQQACVVVLEFLAWVEETQVPRDPEDTYEHGATR